jgi:hypothetical protein
LSEKPSATAASVFIEHGAITMPCVTNEPLEIAAPTSRTLCTTSASFARSLRVILWSYQAFNARRRTRRGAFPIPDRAQRLQYAHAVDRAGGAGHGDDQPPFLRAFLGRACALS